MRRRATTNFGLDNVSAVARRMGIRTSVDVLPIRTTVQLGRSDGAGVTVDEGLAAAVLAIGSSTRLAKDVYIGPFALLLVAKGSSFAGIVPRATTGPPTTATARLVETSIAYAEPGSRP